jgi:hypothetical protein
MVTMIFGLGSYASPFQAVFLQAEHSNKFVINGLGRKSLHREKQVD